MNPWLKRMAELHPAAVMRSLVDHCESRYSSSSRPMLARRGSSPAVVSSPPPSPTTHHAVASGHVDDTEMTPTKAEAIDKGAIAHAMSDIQCLIPWIDSDTGGVETTIWFPTAAVASEPVAGQFSTLKSFAECKQAFQECTIQGVQWSDVGSTDVVRKLCSQRQPVKAKRVDDDGTFLLEVTASNGVYAPVEELQHRIEMRLGGAQIPNCSVPGHNMCITSDTVLGPGHHCNLCRARCLGQWWRCAECAVYYCFSCRPHAGTRHSTTTVPLAHTQWAVLAEYALVTGSGQSAIRVAKNALLRGKSNARLGENVQLEDALAAMPRNVKAALKVHELARAHQLCRPDADGLISSIPFILLSIQLQCNDREHTEHHALTQRRIDFQTDFQTDFNADKLQRDLTEKFVKLPSLWMDSLARKSIAVAGLWVSLGIFWSHSLCIAMLIPFQFLYKTFRECLSSKRESPD